MLERFAAQVLNRYIGQYVENFNTENLSIGIVQGAVELEGLLLRKDALKEFDLPGIEVKWGYIGKIALRIPSYKSYSEPWVIDINKLYLIVGPSSNDDANFDAQAEKTRREQQKLKQLEELEEKWHATQGSSKSIYAIWHSYSSSIVTNIVENLQVRLFDLHIRYEDDMTLPETFAFGIHVNVLSAQTTDENWEPTSSSKQGATKKWKRMHLADMSFYWDTKSHVIDGLSHGEIVNAMENHSSDLNTVPESPSQDDDLSSHGSPDEHQYILSPVSGEARFTRACSLLPLRSKQHPRLALDLDLTSIPLYLNRTQYCQILALLTELSRWDTRRQHRQGRPTKSILGNANVWWKWAIETHVQKVKLQRQRRTLEFVIQRAHTIVNYVKTYRQFLNAKYVAKTQTTDLISSLQEIGTNLTFSELRILHELVYNEINEENKKKREAEALKLSKSKKSPTSENKKEKAKTSKGWQWGGWLGKWGGQSSPNKMDEEALDVEESMEENQEDDDEIKKLIMDNQAPTLHESVFKDLNDDEIYAMFGDELSDQDTTDTFIKRDSVLLRLNFTLKSGTLTLTEDLGTTNAKDSNGIVSLKFNTVKVGSEWRPRYGTHEIKIDLGGIVLKDLNPDNTSFCDLVKPSMRKQRPMSPINITPPGSGMRTLANDMFNNLFSLGQSKSADSSTVEADDSSQSMPVFSVTYKKLPTTDTGMFSDRLEVVTAPLTLTFLPGIMDRLKTFFKTPQSGDTNYALSGVESELLTSAARQRYEVWMKQAQAEVQNTVRRLMEGKATKNVSKDRWAISLDIFAPEIIIPETWSDPDSSIVVLNLGHMTFENHSEGELNRHGQHNANPADNRESSEDYDSDDDDDDFITPPNTPPSELELMSMSQRGSHENSKVQEDINIVLNKDPPNLIKTDTGAAAEGKAIEADIMDQEVLSERMLWDKMYERYHMHFTDLQVVVASSLSKWDAYRLGGKSPLHLVDRFSVELLAEKRVVPTTDPRYPAIMLTGNLPHLTLHISHKKIHMVTKCLEQLRHKENGANRPDLHASDEDELKANSPLSQGFNIRKHTSGSDLNLERANSKQLACDFLINQISVVLEEEIDNQILSVLEVSRIQLKFIERPFDTTTSLSIYSLLLVDVMQQLGHDYELLLASHRNVYMDVASGNMLDSGSVSPMSLSQAQQTTNTTHIPVKRCSSESSKLSRPSDGKLNLPQTTSTMLHTVAENLQRFTNFSNSYLSHFQSGFAEEITVQDNDGLPGSSLAPNSFEYLITLEIKSLRNGSPDLDVFRPEREAKACSPCNIVNANFNNLDVVFNANSWVTILNFFHKLNPSVSSVAPENSVPSTPQETLRTVHFDPHQIKEAPGTTSLKSQSSSQNEQVETHINIDFKQLNVLLLRHVVKFDRTVGRKVATLTMQGTNVVANLGSQNTDNVSTNFDVQIDVTGSIASLQMQDLTAQGSPSHSAGGLEVLSIGTHENLLNTSPGKSMTMQDDNASSSDESVVDSEAFSFEFKQGAVKLTESDEMPVSSKNAYASVSMSQPILPTAPRPDRNFDATVSDTMMFEMDVDDSTDQGPRNASRTESRVLIKLASTCYIHSPRLLAEVLALSDEAGEFAHAQMTTATRQAYKDMARSIMDKVSDYSMAVLGKSMMADELIQEDHEINGFDTTGRTGPNLMQKSFKRFPSANEPKLCFCMQMQTPIVALPKFPGSFELLVANLGQITVQNDHDLSNGSGPLDKLNIEVLNMNLRSHRQRKEELAAKKSTERIASGPSIAELKKSSLQFMNILNADESSTCDTSQPSDIQILHKTSLQLSVHRKPFIPSSKSFLDVRKCCKDTDQNHCSENESCEYFTSHIGPLSDKRMCVNIHAASALTVTLSKLAYEQVLKTLDNVAFGGDIDDTGEEDNVVESSQMYSDGLDGKRKPCHSASAPSLLEVPLKSTKTMVNRSALSSTSSHQSTPRHGKEFTLFEVPGLEIPNKNASQNVQTIPVRKYTPISADFVVPCLIFQLSGDLSEGEQGIVKVTLQEFAGAYQKENKFGTAIDLSLGSLDIEDLLQAEESVNRHIVVSFSPENEKSSGAPLKTNYMSTSCPAFLNSSSAEGWSMSTSLPILQKGNTARNMLSGNRKRAGVFRPYESLNLSSGAFGSLTKRNRRQSHHMSTSSSKDEFLLQMEQPPTPPSSPTRLDDKPENDKETADEDDKLVRIQMFLVDGNSEAYTNAYDRVNRRINVDFNSLDCKVNLQTWVVLLDFFGIGTSPKKTYQLDHETEKTFSWDKRLDVMSFYENQPNAHINSEIDFTVRCFNLTFNKLEYELLKANVGGLQSHAQIRDGTLRIFGQLGNLSVSDLSPNGSLYRERFIFTGDKALDFDVMKFDEYDYNLEREFDISVRLRMSSIRYVHTQRFQNETVAFCQHFQQLQEVLGRMRAASVGQSVRATSCRQARVQLDIDTDAPIILIPESSHSERLLVANLGHITVRNEFKKDGSPGTLSYQNNGSSEPETNSSPSEDLLIDIGEETLQSPRPCILDTIHVDLIDMDLFTASYSRNTSSTTSSVPDCMHLVFPSYTVTCDAMPLLKEKVKLELQMERNLEKEITHQGVPDTSLSARLSSVYCALDHKQYWLVRGVLDHNAGEAIPDFPQPTAFLQPSKLQTVLTGAVYTGLSMDFYLSNVSIELLEQHATDDKPFKSLGRLDFVKSKLSYRAYSDNIKTTNLSCEAFRAHDTRYSDPQGHTSKTSSAPSVFTTILGPMELNSHPLPKSNIDNSTPLQFEIYQRSGPGFMEFTALLNDMRVYLILDWLMDMNKYIIENPNQERCDSLRSYTAQLMATYGQVDSGNQRGLDNTGQLEPEIRSTVMKMSFTDTEFVVVEDTSRTDSDAVILRSTAVLQYSPDGGSMTNSSTSLSLKSNVPLSCSLQSLEVFSCQLDKENETALSIIDPVTVNFEVRAIKQTDLTIEDISSNPSLLDKTLLDIHVSDLNMRVSYNDVMLFLNILNSLPTQAGMSGKGAQSVQSSLHGSDATTSSNRLKAVYQPTQQSVEPLVELGYSTSDVVHALTVSSGNVETAGSWLVEHASLQASSQVSNKSKPQSKSVPLDISRVSMKVDVVRVCLIDDCAEDCDVPLTEIAIHTLNMRQALADTIGGSPKDAMLGQTGSATFKLSGDYYNRMLSLWEPFLEPWRCNVCWTHELSKSEQTPGKWNVELQASDRFDVSVTSTLIETVKKTGATWRHDYARANANVSKSVARKRQPFVPYLLRNLTGSPLHFATQTAALHENDMSSTGRKPASDLRNWTEVLPGEDCSFNFATIHEKQRHKRSTSLKLHQISVQVGEWKTLQPVTVSKVGVYFRHAFKQISKSSTVYEPSVPVRVVFAVTLEGSAQKIVTVRSALVVRSRVKIPIQIQLQLPSNREVFTLPMLDPGDTQHVPLALTSCSIKIRPCVSISGPYQYSSTSVRWQSLPPDGQESSELIECRPSNSAQPPFNFAVCIQRKPYPSYEEVCDMLTQQGEIEDQRSTDWEGVIPQLPGHTIIILPPVVISNLLPCDLHYYVKNTNVEGTLKPGMDATPHAVHVQSNPNQSSLIVGCLLENFQSCRELIVPSIVKNFQMRMLIKDYKNETLILNVRILWRLNCSVKISIMAGYWVINKTGLPIVVKQEGTLNVAAGQYDAHEQARSLQPLLFSYANREAPYLCTMRLGRKAQLDDFPHGSVRQLKGAPSFCERFSTDGGSCTRNLKLITNDGTPNREFCIGISVRRGWGRYLHTHIVTVAPRFLLFNRTRFRRLSFAQRHTISYTADSAGTSCHLTIMPGSSVVFHWPRVDLDTLLCVRLADEASCHWSGGFFIDRTDAFHVALRLASGAHGLSVGEIHPLAPHCVFLNIEVTLVNATYCIMVSDADPSLVPPPLRVDNVSSAPIIFKQVGTDESYNTEVPAETQLAYACDEPCLPQLIECGVRGGSSRIKLDMNVIGAERQLYYENFIYISLGTPSQQSSAIDRLGQDRTVLVMDVQGGQRSHYISLQPLRSGKRSQLWRMTSDGRIYHEGSSPPEKDTGTQSSQRQHRNSGLVLDIAEMAISVGRQLDQGIPLALRPTDERRRSTQTWSFEENGRLQCRHRNLCVQVSSLVVGCPAVLAPFDEARVCLPAELCSRHKLIPGSGVLSLKVVRDGPTRVLRVVDIRQKRAGIFSKASDWTILESPNTPSTSNRPENDLQTPLATHNPGSKFFASISMPKGVGISLISNTPEELLYLTMNGVNMEISAVPGEQAFSLRVQKIQIDNQLLDGYPTVMLCPRQSSTSRSSPRTSTQSHSSSTDPLISVHAIRQPSTSRMYQIYKSLVVDVGRLSIAIEERLMLKLLHFAGFGPASSEHDSELLDEAKMDVNISVSSINEDRSARRFYFDTLRLSAAPLHLSVLTASRLVPELKAIKRALTFSLVQFERAPVAIQEYVKRHLFETVAFILADFSKHLRDQLKSQAAKILGSVDFLGNPIGLISDVKAGVSGLARGNLQNMVMHITHGLSDSTAKFTSTLSDGLGEISMDEDYEDKRRAIQANARSNAGSHVVAGLQGLMAGVIGGLTSVITQPVKGAQNDGAKGFFKGIGKGLVGTVAKPVAGVLDLASESASAVREISISSDKIVARSRPVRCCHSFQGCLQCYSQSQADGQAFLYALNHNDYAEHFYSLNELSIHKHDNILVLTTNKKVYFVKDAEPDADHVLLVVDYAYLLGVCVVPPQVDDHQDIASTSQAVHGDKTMLEITIKSTPRSGMYSYNNTNPAPHSMRYVIKKPRVTCRSQSVAERVCQQIRYAKNLASEQTETLQCDPDEEEAQDRAFDLEV